MTLSVGCGVGVGASVGAVVVGAAADAWAVGRVGRVGAVRVRAAPVAVARAGHAGRTGPRGRAGRAGHAGRRAQRRGRLAERAPLARLARRRPVCWEREKDRVGLVRTRDSGWGAAGSKLKPLIEQEYTTARRSSLYRKLKLYLCMF